MNEGSKGWFAKIKYKSECTHNQLREKKITLVMTERREKKKVVSNDVRHNKHELERQINEIIENEIEFLRIRGFSV